MKYLFNNSTGVDIKGYASKAHSVIIKSSDNDHVCEKKLFCLSFCERYRSHSHGSDSKSDIECRTFLKIEDDQIIRPL
jgi:hypothetical protein